MKYQTAFTLIELLVVILIIGILAAVALPQYQKAIEKAHSAEAITQLKALAQAEKAYFLANGKYTRNWDDLDIDISGESTGSIYIKHQKNWYLALSQANKTNPYIYAAKEGETEKDGRYYFIYILATDQIFCQAYSNDIKGNSICQSFGNAVDCPTHDGSSYICYELP